MRKNMFKILLLSAAMCLCLILSADVVFAQCGADGTKPCNPTTPKKTTTPKKPTTPKKTTTPKKPTTPKTTTVSKPKPTTKKPQTKIVARVPEIEMVKIPAGSFMMGSNNGSGDEKPVHKVTISQAFFMGKTEVTQAQWQAVMGNNPSNFRDCPTCPIEQVSWDDAQEFIKKLNAKGEGTYRLPTEAEWECAARAGTTGDYAGNLDSMGWYSANSDSKTHPVGTKQANAWGLYDMHGNVWEWCQDWYGEYPSGAVTNPTGATSGSDRVGRGGGWSGDAVFLRSANRSFNSPSYRSNRLGFRVVRN